MIIMLWLDYIDYTSILVILKEHSPYFVKKKLYIYSDYIGIK